MADAGEVTEKRKEIQKKKYYLEMSRLVLKLNQLEITRLEKEEELEILDRKLDEVKLLIKEKEDEIGGLDG